MEPTIQTMMKLKVKNEQQGALIRDEFKSISNQQLIKLNDLIFNFMQSGDAEKSIVGVLAHIKFGELLEQRANS